MDTKTPWPDPRFISRSGISQRINGIDYLMSHDEGGTHCQASACGFTSTTFHGDNPDTLEQAARYNLLEKLRSLRSSINKVVLLNE